MYLVEVIVNSNNNAENPAALAIKIHQNYGDSGIWGLILRWDSKLPWTVPPVPW